MANENNNSKSTLRLNNGDAETATVSKQSAPRTTLKLSDWDEIKRPDGSEEKDSQYVPPHLIPDGFSVEWKRTEILGKPDTKNIVKIEASGWRPAPVDLFLDILPSGYKGTTVEDGAGNMLYIRPQSFTDKAKEEEYNKATSKVKDYERSTLNDLSTVHKDVPKKAFNYERTFEKAIAVPD